MFPTHPFPLCAVITGPSLGDALEQIDAVASRVSAIELRLDALHNLALDELRQLRTRTPLPLILTFRRPSDGGMATGLSEDERLKQLSNALNLDPDFVDIEWDVSHSYLNDLKKNFPRTSLILSHHDCRSTPAIEAIERLENTMRNYPAALYKLAFFANGATDALRLMKWGRERGRTDLILVSMGAAGQWMRPAAPIAYSALCYALPILNENSEISAATGILSVDALTDLYRVSRVHRETPLYGLIGEDVSKSCGHITHNGYYAEQRCDALYVKIPVKPCELESSLQLIKQLPFRGLSVTTPFKASILPLIDAITPDAEAMGAVNTLTINGGKIFGSNTDGPGALNAIEHSIGRDVAGLRLVIVGAGGTGHAITWEAIKRGASVAVLNRTPERAEALGGKLGIFGGGLDHLPRLAREGYDGIIHATSSDLSFEPETLLPTAFALEVRNRPTPFTHSATARGCLVIEGMEMFREQALLQHQLWFSQHLPSII
ncbi:MAG: type I 3-dehydroquinate dehydratase [Chlamydiia bacterium]|nr:type I 3-dehydroquinate dehydratase [Chlamydiia bacterium]